MECDRCKREAVFQADIEYVGKRNLCSPCLTKQITDSDSEITAKRLADLPYEKRKPDPPQTPVDIYRIIWCGSRVYGISLQRNFAKSGEVAESHLQ